MADAALRDSGLKRPEAVEPLWLRVLKNEQLQIFASRMPGLRWLVCQDQKRVFDLMSGFVYSQVLFAAVQIDLFAQVLTEDKSPKEIRGLGQEAAEILCRSLAGIGLLKAKRNGQFGITRHGAIIETIPGLKSMIHHHAVLYRDLQNPIGVLEGIEQTEMAEFWPYVFGATDRPVSDAEAKLYSKVMSDTQALVAREVLTQVNFGATTRLLDVGGGRGTFLSALRAVRPNLELGLFDLPSVVAPVTEFQTHSGNFRKDPLPKGYDTISLIRIFFDHQDETVATLLSKAFEALPDGGRIIVAEPMAGMKAPTAEGDAYYAIYTRAMRTGKTRKPQDIASLLVAAGFSETKIYPDRAPAVARVIEAKKSSQSV